MSRAVPVIREPGLGTDVTGKGQDTESDDSKSSTSTELCDEPDRLSDFDSEEPTSVSDTSSHVVSTGEANVTKLPFPSPADKSGLPAPESSLENDFSPLKPLKDVIIPPKSGESIVSDTKHPIISPSKETEFLTSRTVWDVAVTSPAAATNNIKPSSMLKENFELSSQRETSSPTVNVFDLNPSPLKDISVCETTPEIYFSAVDNTVKLLISEDTCKPVSSKEIISVTEHDHSKQFCSDKSESLVKTNVSYTGITEQSSVTEEKSPVSSGQFASFHKSELKMETSEEDNNDEIILKEKEDSHRGSWTTKSIEVSEVLNVVESDTHFIKQPNTCQSGSEVMQVEDKTKEKTVNNISADLKSVKITDSSMQKSTSILEITQKDHWGTADSLKSPVTETMQCFHGMQDVLPTSLQFGEFLPTTPTRMLHVDISRNVDRDDTRESDVETKEELKIKIKIDRICTERSIPEIDTSCVAFGDVAKCDSTDAEQTKVLQDLGSDEDRSVNVCDSENISKLLELNQRLQGQEQVIRDGYQACEVEDIAGSDMSEIDYAEVSDLLQIEQNINLGRRNSERALKIIQENSEILQRILQCQARRASKVSEEETSGGTTTIPSEADSIPTSSSAENVDITSCQELQAVTTVPKTDSSDSCILAVVSPVHGVSVELPSVMSLSSPICSHSLLKSDKAIKVFPRHPQPEKGKSMELQGRQQEKEEDGRVTTAEHFDTHCSSVLVKTEEFMKTCDFLEPRQGDKMVSSPSSARSFTLSPETSSKEDSAFSIGLRVVRPKSETDVTQVLVLHPTDEQFPLQSEDRTASKLTRFSNEDPRFSLGSEIVKRKTETADVTKVLHPTDEKFLLQSEDRHVSELTGTSVPSSYPFDDSVHHVERTVHRPTELDLGREHFPPTTQSGWKRFPAMDSSLSENVFPKFPKFYSPEPKTHTSYCSYSSKGVKESLQFLDSPVIPVTDTKALTSVKWTDNDDDGGDMKTDKHFIMVEKASSDFHTDTSFSQFSRDSSPSLSRSLEKCKLKDEESTTDSHNLLCASSNHSTYSSCHSTSKPYTSISRYEYSPIRIKSKNTEKESNTDYLQHDNFKYRETLSSWYNKDSATHPSDSFTFKYSSAKTEITPVDDYLQKSSSCKSKLTEDFHYSVHPDTSSAFNCSSGIQDVVRRTTTRDHSRPHSTIISDITSTEILNRSHSSSSIDGYLMRMRKDLSSPSASPNNEQPVSSFKSVGDESSSVALKRTKNSVYSPTHETDISIKVPDTVPFTHSSKSPFESRFITKDLSPQSYSSFQQSRWNKDDPSSSSSMKSEYIKESSDSQTFSTESSLVSTSLSTTKVDKSYSPTVSPAKSKDIHVSLPPIKSSVLGSPTKSKSKFDPFPPRPTMRQPKELGIKLGLYSTDCVNKNVKAASKKT